ncbi:MAG: hypothetical protein JJ847_07935 [Prochlorococcus marinus CUG1438]|nr:hypothetical protein [Prochlorococcus marinus CUG1438]
MINSKLLVNKIQKNNLICSEDLYKGACVKIKNSNKTFQVIGLNIEKKICWVREWPFACDFKKTFALEINQITLQVFCSKQSKIN